MNGTATIVVFVFVSVFIIAVRLVEKKSIKDVRRNMLADALRATAREVIRCDCPRLNDTTCVRLIRKVLRMHLEALSGKCEVHMKRWRTGGHEFALVGQIIQGDKRLAVVSLAEVT